jgi:hypothetical protein
MMRMTITFRLRAGQAIAGLLAVAVVGGCARLTGANASRAPRSLTAGYASIDSLVKLHPGYPQLAALDRWALTERRAAGQAARGIPAPTSHSFAPVRGADLQPPAVEAVLDRVKQVTSEEVERIGADLRARAQAELARRTRDATRRAQERIAGPRADLLSKLEQARRQILLEFRPQIENLRLQVTNIEGRLRLPRLLPEEAAPAQAQLDTLRQELTSATKAQTSRLDAVQKQYDAQLAALERDASDEAERQVAAARQRLQADVGQELARERERLMAPLAAAAQEMTLGLELPEVEPAVVAPAAMRQDMLAAAATAGREQTTWPRDMAGGARNLAALRRKLADRIRRDTELTVQALARAHGFRVRLGSAQPARSRSKGASPLEDVTRQAQQWLRAYWRA